MSNHVRTLTAMSEFEEGQRVQVTLRNPLLPERPDIVTGTVTFTPRLGVVSEATGTRYSLLASEDDPSLGLSGNLIEAVLLTPEGTSLVPSPGALHLGQKITVQHRAGAGGRVTITGRVTRNHDGDGHTDRMSVTGIDPTDPGNQRVWYLTPPEDESRWWDTISFVATPPADPEETEVLRQRVADLERVNHNQAELLTSFKKRVGVRAMQLAAEHDWCDVVTNALDDLDIPVPSRRTRATVVLTFQMEGTPVQRDPDASWVRASLDILDGDQEVNVSMDGDWSEVTFDHIDTEVLEVEDVID